jgi:hypothetical protein
MNERLIEIALEAGEVGVTLGDAYKYAIALVPLTVVGVVCSASANDADLTVDINDDGTGVITAIACATAATPGTWKSTHIGGTETPVRIAKDSVISLDANSAAANTRIRVGLLCLTGE